MVTLTKHLILLLGTLALTACQGYDPGLPERGSLTPLYAINQIQKTRNQTIKELNIGERVEQVKMKADEWQFYKVQVRDQVYKDEDLIIKVIPLSEESDPDVYISKTEKYPMSPLESDWQCASYGKDTCTIHNSNLNVGQVFYFGVTCMSHDCSFQVKVQLTSEFVLEDGIEFQTLLQKEDVRLFRFTIPPQLGENTSITIKASAYQGSVHDFNLEVRGTQNGSVPRRGIPAWKKGQVVRINSKNFDGWCDGCEIKILLDVQDSGYYHIMAMTSDSTPLLQNMNQVDDIVDLDDIQCYKYFIGSAESDVQIQLSTYSGRVSFHANAEAIPEQWDDFRIKPDDGNDTDLILDLRPWVRQHRTNKLTGLYYICVKGELTSTYSLRIKEFMQDMSKPIEIEDGFSEHFFSRGTGMQIFLYNVPKLEYGGEDIKVEFTLTIKRGNGEDIVLASALCESENITQCTESLDQQQVLMPPTRYKKAQKVAGPLQQRLVLDHDETKCEKQLHGHCTYVVAVINIGSSDVQHWARYKIVASHSQNNHILLQEGQPQIFSVDHKQYKYFKFTLMEKDETKIENVTFELSPLHGDCDIVLSRNDSQQFPTKENGNFELKSQRIGGLVDHITVEKNKSSSSFSLSTTYYIGVYGYSQATFSLLVNVKRNIVKGQLLQMKKIATSIYEGFPLTKRLHNELDMFFGQFSVEIAEGDEQAIIIDISNSEGKTSTFIRYGDEPGLNTYDKKLSGEGVIKISPGDPAYHKSGNYYVMVLPDFKFFDIFIDNYYTFQFSWRLQDTVPHINSARSHNLQIKPQQYSYMRHFVQETTEDIRISLMSNQGHMDLFVNLGSSNVSSHHPTNTSFEFSTKFMKGGNYMNSKALLIPIALLQNTNPACKDFGYAEDQACVLYIGVQCVEQQGECDGLIELDYESKTPKRVYPGQSKHQIMYSESVNYYYLTVTPQTIQDLIAVLTPQVGDADLYVQVQKLNHSQISSSPTAGMDGYLGWSLPNEINNTYESKSRMNAEMINLPKEELVKHCGFIKDVAGECLIIFAVIPYIEKTIGPEPEREGPVVQEQIHYDFSVYKNFIQLRKQTPVSSQVTQGEFKYYIYKETCQSCNILISVVSLTNNGDMEIFINKGLKKLPTQADYDFNRNTLKSEIISLSLDQTAFLQNLTTMADYYIIGVYGDKNTTYQLSVTSADEPIIEVTDGMLLKHQQVAFTMTYFQYYHFYQDFDIELELHVSQGAADIYVTTFNQTGEDFVQKLPKRKSDAIWISEDVNSINSGSEDKEILILQIDRNYCVDCYYLIGVVTHEGPASYQLSLLATEVERNSSSRLLRIGMPKTVKLNNRDNKLMRYQFMLDSKLPASIVPTLVTGNVKISLSFEDLEDSFYSQESASIINLSGDRLRTDQNYFIFLEALSDVVELSITVEQQLSVQRLGDGQPQLINYNDYQDTSKYLMFDMPPGSATVVFQVKSKTPDFFPKLFVSLRNSSNLPIFPPDELMIYDVFEEKDWDQDLYALKATLKFDNIPQNAFLGINLKYHTVTKHESIQSTATKGNKSSTAAQALITVSHTKITKLPAGEDYFGELNHGTYRFHLFKIVVPSSQKTTQITFTSCLGTVVVSVVQDPGNLANRTLVDFKDSEGKRVGIIQNLQEEVFILVESFSEDPDQPAEYMVRVDFFDSIHLGMSQSSYFIAQDGGRIHYEYLRRKGNVKISWGPLYKVSLNDPLSTTKSLEGVKYKLVFSENQNAIMDSVCAIKRQGIAQSHVFTVYEDMDGDNQFIAVLAPNKDIQFNVIAVVGKDQVAIPYKPIYLKSPDRRAYGGRLFISILLLTLILFALLALYYYCKGRKLQQRLAEEVRDVDVTNPSQSEGAPQFMSYRRVKGDQQVMMDDKA